MASIRTLLSLAALPASLLACGGGSEGLPTPSGPHHTYVASTLSVPTGPAQAREFGLDLGGTKTIKPDGMVDNQLGMVLGTLQGQMLDVQGTITNSVKDGSIILLIDFQSSDLTSSSGAGLSVKLGDSATAMPKPCTNDADPTTCGKHLAGTGVFTLSANSPANAVVAGKIVGGTFNGGPGDLALQITLGGAAITLNLHGARAKASGMTETGMESVILADSVLKTDLDTTVLPNIATMLTPIIESGCPAPRTPPGCNCTGTAKNVIMLFDTNPQDCAVTVDELKSNTFIQNLLAPDVCGTADSDCTAGPNALSLGIKVTAVKATFPTPARELDEEIETSTTATTAE